MSVVQHVDDLLRELLHQGPLEGTRIPVTFETPGPQWAAHRDSPCVNIFLHTLEEDATRSQSGDIGIVDEDGAVIGYRKPPRYFALSYLVTVWAQTVADEHRVLGGLLEWCADTEELLPPEHDGRRFTMRLRGCAGPESEGGVAARVWSALGTPPRPALDLVVTVPLERRATEAVPAPVRGATLRFRRLSPSEGETGPRGEDSSDRGPGRPRRNVKEVG